jgi:hypothetical protein
MPVKYINPIDARAPQRHAEQALALAMETYAEEFIDTLREVAPKGETGDLSRGLHMRQVNRFEYVIEGEADYTEAVLRGHRRFWVEPKSSPVLHWSAGGIDFFSKGHWIPRTEGQNFVARAEDIERPRMPTYFGEAAAMVRKRGA